MHRSRLCTALIDCEGSAFEKGIAFWGRALGMRVKRRRDQRYVSLVGELGGEGGLNIVLQHVPKGERGVHLDIETDDVEAEVARLEKIGARRKANVRSWVVMEAPSGHAFCVVPVQRKDFPAGASEWK